MMKHKTPVTEKKLNLFLLPKEKGVTFFHTNSTKMNRRDTIKTIFVGTLAGGAIATGCNTEPKEEKPEIKTWGHDYGRFPEEKEHDQEVLNEDFFNAHEMATITILCDLICPKDERSGSATEAEVPDFIEFIVKDIPTYQLPMRGGLMWLDRESLRRFDKAFKDLSASEQTNILDDISYAVAEDEDHKFPHGYNFFSLISNITMSGFYTSQMGFEDLGYVGNMPNEWNGVPQDVLDKHGLAYEEEWLAKCIDHTKKNEVAEWDEDGNLLN